MAGEVIVVTTTAVSDVEVTSTGAAWSYQTPGAGQEHLLGPTVKHG